MTPDPARLADRISFAPRPFDPDAASRVDADERLQAGFSGSAYADVRKLITGVAGCSPYLRGLMTRRPAMLAEIVNAAPEAMAARAVDEAWAAADEPDDATQLSALRAAKARASLTLALGEIAGALDVMTAARLFSAFADAACGAALRMALRRLSAKGVEARDAAVPEATCGLAVIAMGKHGAGELNYSSDIDLIFVFDGEAPALGGAATAKSLAVAATKLALSRLSDQTPDGYVFRTDIRLRPDPGVSAAAVSANAAEAYYEAYGQNWERAAFIKARAAAGDIAFGEAFLKRLRPFVWRKYLDYAAIEDIHSIKRQIHAAKGGAEIEFAGHDLKTGRGGIREIEFIAQIQQLILGGKDESLRARDTLSALDALAARGAVSEDARDDLARAYRYLRTVEHRIQMIADEQTHRVPADAAGAARLAMFLGEPDADALEARLTETLQTVHRRFSDVFGRAEALSGETGSLSFTGVDFDPDTLETLTRLGFRDARLVAATIRGWHAGEIRPTRGQRARELLTKLTPRLLGALSEAERPDEAFLALDRFLRRLPAGVQIFSLFMNKPSVFDTLIRIMTISPYLGRALADRRHLVEAATESSWPAPASAAPLLDAMLGETLAGAPTFEAKLNAARRWAAEENFNLAAQAVLGVVDPTAAATGFTRVAETIVRALLPVAQAEMEARHGGIDGRIAVVAMGRLGAGAMTAASDIDLVFVYDCPPGAMSDGEKPLDGAVYFTRLVRRFLTAVSAHTEEGAIYDVDMQLRPSGRAGPAAIRLDAFRRYYGAEAWVWELMALVKARVVAGPDDLAARLAADIDTIIAADREARAIRVAVDDMRARLLRDKPASSVWDVKLAHGGATDIDFIVAYLTLVQDGGSGFARIADTPAAIAALAAAGRLSIRDAETLAAAFATFEAVAQIGRAAIGRAAIGGAFQPARAGAALKARMAAALGAPDFNAAAALLEARQKDVREIYAAIVGGARRQMNTGE